MMEHGIVWIPFRLDWEHPHVLNRTLVWLAIDVKINHIGTRFKKDWNESRTYRTLVSAGLRPKPRHVRCALNVLRHNWHY